MARKAQVSIQQTLESNEDLDSYLDEHKDELVFLEVYSEFCGPCLATATHVRKAKLEIGQDRIAAARIAADNSDELERFRDNSEPVFLFIFKRMLTRCMFGANGIELCRVVEEELALMQKEIDTGVQRHSKKVPLNQMLPEEIEKKERDMIVDKAYKDNIERLRTLTLAARKKRVAARLAEHVKQMNFILFWPQCHQAHYDLYEKWDNLGLQVGAKEEIQLKEEDLKEVFYMSDIDVNEAAAYALMDGEALVVMFKMFASDNRDIIQLMRHGLYEEIPVPKEDLLGQNKPVPLVPAFERYASISKTEREVRRDRYEARQQKLRDEQEERDRLAREQARLAQQAADEKEAEEQRKRDEERMARIQAGLPPDPEPPMAEEAELVEGAEGEDPETKKAVEQLEEVKPEEPEAAEEEMVEAVVEEDFHSDVAIEDEPYIPPGGLFVPGLYSPPNELAKANGLAFFFPKHVMALCPIETEYLPPHVLVMFPSDKRHEVLDVVNQYRDEILQIGVFMGEDPFNCEHIAYSIRQYDKIERPRYKDKVALMVSRKRSLPLLQLAGLNPCYISSDETSGERDCLTMFPVGYGDEFVEEDSVLEEIVEEETVVATAEPEPVVVEEEDEDDDDDEDQEE